MIFLKGCYLIKLYYKDNNKVDLNNFIIIWCKDYFTSTGYWVVQSFFVMEGTMAIQFYSSGCDVSWHKWVL